MKTASERRSRIAGMARSVARHMLAWARTMALSLFSCSFQAPCLPLNRAHTSISFTGV